MATSSNRLVVLALLVLAVDAAAEPAQRDAGLSPLDGVVSVAPATGTDIAPGPPAELAALRWLTPLPPTLGAGGPLPMAAPPLRLRVDLPQLFGVPWYARTTVAGIGGALRPSTELGTALLLGPLQTGTNFSLSRDRAGLWVNNASYARYVAPTFDLGVETANSTLLTTPRLGRSSLQGSVGVRLDEDSPTLRVSTTLVPAASRAWSSVSAFGSF